MTRASAATNPAEYTGARLLESWDEEGGVTALYYEDGTREAVLADGTMVRWTAEGAEHLFTPQGRQSF